MPFIPEAQYKPQQTQTPSLGGSSGGSGPDLGSILSKVGGGINDVGNFLLAGRLKPFEQQYSNYANNILGKIKKGQVFQSPAEDLQTQIQSAKMAAPVAAAASMYTIPGAGPVEEGASGLGKALLSAGRYALPGAVYGATAPGQMSLGQRLGSTATSAATSGILGPLVEGVLNKIGLGAGKMAINPNVKGSVSSVFDIPAAKTAAVSEALGQTSGLDTESMATQMKNVIDKTTKSIESSLESIPSKLSFQNDIKPGLYSYLRDNLPELKNTPDMAMKAKGGVQDMYSLVKPFVDKITNYGDQGVTDTSFSLKDLFNSRQAVDDVLKQTKTFDKMGNDVTPPLTEKIGMGIRSYLKDLVNNTASQNGAPGISDLTEMESRLYAAGKGIAGQGGRGTTMAPRSPASLLMRSLFGPSLIPIARAGTSSAVQNGTLLQILNALGIGSGNTQQTGNPTFNPDDSSGGFNQDNTQQ